MSRHGRNNLKLDPEAVRRRASAIVGCVEIPSPSSAKKKSPSKQFVSKIASPSKTSGYQGSSVVSYLVGVASPGVLKTNKVEDLARVTIYCDTGTIATGRICNGSIRHVFRRNVTSLDVVERCLKFPAALPKVDWHLVSLTDSGIHDNSNSENTSSNLVSIPREKSIKNNLDLCDVGLALLQSERDKLIQHINALKSPMESSVTLSNPIVQVAKANKHNPSRLPQQNQQQQQSTSVSGPQNAMAASAGPITTSGMEFQFSLAERPMKHVDQCLTDIQKMNKIVHAVSTNGVGTVFLYGNGGVAYTPNIPRTLYQKLSQLRYSKVHSSRPQYVSLGSRERYFVAFHDGTVSYKGPKGLDKELRKLTPPSQATNGAGISHNSSNNIVHQKLSSSSSLASQKAFASETQQQSRPLWPLRSVAFGSSYDTFCIVFHDGSYKYQGKSFPRELEDALVRYRKRQAMAQENNTFDDGLSSSDERYRNPNDYDSNDELNEILSSASSRLSPKKSDRKLNYTSGNFSDDDGGDYPLDHYYHKKKADGGSHNPKQQTKANSHQSTARNANSITCINLGPSGEWFLRTEDGYMEWGGISSDMDEAIQQLLEDGHHLNYFDFGEDSSYFVSYD